MLRISGFCTDTSGYGEMARRFVRVATRLGPVEIVVSCTDGGPQLAWTPPPAPPVPAVPPYAPYPPHVIVAAPHQFELLRTDEGRQIGYTCWETDRLPDRIVDACREMSRLFVPSQQMVDTFAKHGLTAHRVPIPMGLPTPGRLPVTGIALEDVVFYSMLTWQPRKHPMGLLTAYLTAFTASDPVVLVVKVGGALGELRLAQGEYAALLGMLALPAPPRVMLVGGSWTPEQIAALHARGNVYVSLTRGEAFGIPMFDALSVGNAVIAPDWGGHLDYLQPHPLVTLVPARLTPVVQKYVYFDGTQCWADPDLLAARAEMRTWFQRIQWGQMPNVAPPLSDFTEEAVARQLEEAL